ncbi:Fe-S cluster assembly sulfur transfer protein SufU [Pseudactinotalea sp. Z1732]|uniref:Fe-S cluster assembly sulfur transfer protein SufU n=1 Tax=Micrococcales TaxID=85006 RepID=UPI003C7BD923
MSNLDQLYQQVILDHAKQRTGHGLRERADGESFQVNPTCGDEVRLQVHLDTSTGAPRIGEVTWEGMGCSISQASTSVLTELIRDVPVGRADEITEAFRALMDGRGRPLAEPRAEILGDATAFVGVARYPARIKCALLGWMALRDATAQALVADSSGPEDTT